MNINNSESDSKETQTYFLVPLNNVEGYTLLKILAITKNNWGSQTVHCSGRGFDFH